MNTWCNISLLLVLVTLVSLQVVHGTPVQAASPQGKQIVAKNAVSGQTPSKAVKAQQPGNAFPVPEPPFSEGIFPCSQCHKFMEPNPKRRTLTEYHTEIVLHHAEGQRWCTDCHNLKNRDKLRLVSGELIDFTESYRLCGQCHGDKFRDWRVGVHGKRTGNWNGDKQYLLCVHCHNPHDPKFKALKPMAPPNRPGKAHE